MTNTYAELIADSRAWLEDNADRYPIEPRWSKALNALDCLLSENASLKEALERAIPLVEKWCHYQGNNQDFFNETLAPLRAALNGDLVQAQHESVSCNGHVYVHEDGSGEICIHCGKEKPDEDDFFFDPRTGDPQ